MSVQNRINNIRCATHNCPDYKRIFNVSHINHLAPMASMNIIQVSHIIWTRLIIFHRLHFPYKTRANRDGAELNHVWQHFEICEFRSTEEEKKIYLKVLQREKEGALRGEMRWGMCKETWRTVPAMLSSSSSSPSEASSLLGGAGEEEDDEDPVPLMKQLGPCAKPYIALQVSDQDLGLQRLLLCVCELSYQHDVYNLSALWAAAAGLPDGY